MVREFVEVTGNTSIEDLIARLASIKAEMPDDAGEEQVQVRGDEVFGHHILVTYLRPETAEEIESGLRAMRFASAWSECRLPVAG
jgi:hypothetical protein